MKTEITIKDKICRFIVNLLPNRIILWAIIRIYSYTTVHSCTKLSPEEIGYSWLINSWDFKTRYKMNDKGEHKKQKVYTLSKELTKGQKNLIDIIQNETKKINMKKYWETKEGDEIEYKKLEDNHLLNILKWIERRAENGMTVMEGAWCPFEKDGYYDEYEIKGDEVLEKYDYKELVKEAKRRKIK